MHLLLTMHVSKHLFSSPCMTRTSVCPLAGSLPPQDCPSCTALLFAYLPFCSSFFYLSSPCLSLLLADSDPTEVSTVSEAVYHEYDNLRQRYKVEAESMAQAFNRATEWYRENKSLRRETNNLKRQSAILLQRVSDGSPDLDISVLAGMEETTDKKEIQDLQQQHEKEVDNLMNKIKGLENEVANLTMEISKAKQDEFEAQEELLEMRRELEDANQQIDTLKKRTSELEAVEQRMGRVSVLVLDEVEALQAQLRTEAARANTAATEAAKARGERAALARQSAVAMSELMGDEKLSMAMQEVDSLTKQLHKQEEDYKQKINKLKAELLSYETGEKAAELELLRERVQLLEEEVRVQEGKASEGQCEVETLRKEEDSAGHKNTTESHSKKVIETDACTDTVKMREKCSSSREPTNFKETDTTASASHTLRLTSPSAGENECSSREVTPPRRSEEQESGRPPSGRAITTTTIFLSGQSLPQD
ncbi:Shootin-1 [Portunus trituberculatus]|uniref:Shootin-1 n=1 Tax=Portunus trituberculatus TaxID=210409 RepID=A0A5B7F5Q7_PORTR|nr:Shootin-1 [Portunus trituberculatus]